MVIQIMKRNALQDLINWKASEERKPMVLKGARQAGKTWLMREFGQSCYQELLCKGWFLPSNTYDCGSFVVN